MFLKSYSRLFFKIALTTLLFSLIPLFAMGYIIYHQFSDTYTEKVVMNLNTIVENNKRAIDIFLDEKVKDITIILQTHSFDQICNNKYLENLFNSMRSNSYSYIDIGVIDQNGNHVAYVGPYEIQNANYEEETWFQQVMLKGLYISDVFMGFRKFPHFIIAVMRRDGERSWILRATIDLDVFNKLVKSVQVGKLGDAYLVNRDNVLQTGSRFIGPPLSQLRSRRPERFYGTRIEKISSDGKEKIQGMTWLGIVDWMLVVSEDPTEEMSPLIKTQFDVVLLTISGMLVIILGTVLTTQSTVKKIAQADEEAARLDATLMQSSKMAALGKLAAGVAHEVNNPLTLIRESAGWMRDLLSEEEPEKIENYAELIEVAEKIDKHVERAKAVTHRMLGFGRRMEPQQDHVNLNEVAEQTLQFLENEALHRNISIEKHYAKRLPEITSDTTQLQQVFLNLLDNAIDAIEGEGRISLCTGVGKGGKEVFCTISDSGRGIPKDRLGVIFDPFYTTKKVGEGTGLGLSIIYGIIEKLGGRIEVESEEGGGSTFTVYLPVR